MSQTWDGPPHRKDWNYSPGQRVKCLTADGQIRRGEIVVRCGLRAPNGEPRAHWFVKLDDGEQVAVYEAQLERAE